MIYILLSIFLYSLNNVLWKKNLEKTNIFFLISYRSLLTSMISIVLFFAFFNKNSIELNILIKVSLGSVIGTIGLFCMLKALKNTSLQWIGIYNLLGIVFTSFYLHIYEKYDLNRLNTGVIVIIIGYILFVISNRKSNVKTSIKNHILLIIMTISFCTSSIIHWVNLMDEIHPVLIVANQEFFVFIFSTLILLFINKGQLETSEYKKHFKDIIIMSIVILLAVLFSFLGVKQTNPIVLSLLFLASPLLTIILSSIYFKERITTINKVSIFIITIGAFILKYNN